MDKKVQLQRMTSSILDVDIKLMTVSRHLIVSRHTAKFI